MTYHKFCRCGGSILTLEQIETDQLCDRCRKEQVEALNSLKHEKLIKCAWDNPKEDLSVFFKKAIDYGLKPYKLMCFVLIGYWSSPEEDLYRVETLRKLKIDPFVMPYNKKDRYQKDFARWVNHKAIFKSVKWEDYRR